MPMTVGLLLPQGVQVIASRARHPAHITPRTLMKGSSEVVTMKGSTAKKLAKATVAMTQSKRAASMWLSACVSVLWGMGTALS